MAKQPKENSSLETNTREKEIVEEIEKLAQLAKPVEPASFPIVILGGYGRDKRTSDLYNRSVDDPKYSNFDSFALEPEALDSNIKVKFLKEDSNDDVKEVVLPYGVVVVFGMTRSAKTELLKYILKQTSGTFIRFMEPEPPTMTSISELIVRMENFLNSDKQVFAVDSIRDIIYNSLNKSAAGKGGVNTGIYGDLTALNALAANRKKLIIAVVNPTTDDDSAEIMARGIEGSVAGMFTSLRYGAVKFVARTKDNMRTERRYSYKPENEVKIDYNARGSLTLELSQDTVSTKAEPTGSGKIVGQTLIKKLIK